MFRIATAKFLPQRRFQVKYTGYLVLSALFSAIIIGGPSYFFLNQNYDIFIELAYAHSPELIQHLQTEQSWVNGFLVASLVSLMTFQIYFGLKLTFRMVGPLLALKRHIQQATKGVLSHKPLKVRGSDEFHDVIENYNYLYKTLQSQTVYDVKKLKKLKENVKDKEALKLIDQMIEEKMSQVSDSSSFSAPDFDSRRAS